MTYSTFSRVMLAICSFIILGCQKEKKLLDVTYKINNFEDDFKKHEFFEVYSGKDLLWQKEIALHYETFGNDCVATILEFPDVNIYYFENGNIKHCFRDKNVLNKVSTNRKKILVLDSQKEIFKFSIYDLKTGKRLKKIDFSGLQKNFPYQDCYGNCFLEEKNQKFIISYFDGWGEIFEVFTIDEDSYNVEQIEVSYSKNIVDNVKNLPSLH